MEMKSTREGYGEGLLELGKTNDRVVVLTADLKESTKVDRFADIFPDRFIECGVAEQNMMGIAAGMAAVGKIPFVSSYAVFSPGRNWDQLRVSVCYSKLPVKIGGAHAGLSVGPDGATHQALEDVAITRVLPNLVVEVPCDFWEAKKATEAAAEINGPVYIRFFREKTPVMTLPDVKYKIGKADLVWESGRDVAIVGCGPILFECLEAGRRLSELGIGVVIINNHTVKPMDKQAIVEAASECGAMVTVEEHQIAGGMGSAVCEILAENCPIPVEMVGVLDSFGESGKPEELFEKYGLTARHIEDAVKKVFKRKGNLEKKALI